MRAKSAIWLMILVFSGLQCWGQKDRIFERFDFDAGGYALLLRPSFASIGDTTLPAYYIRDIARLRAIRSELTFRKKSMLPNWQTFPEISMLVCQNGRVVESISMFNAQNMLEVASTGTFYEFDGYFPLRGYELSRAQKFLFPNLNVARAGLDSILTLPGLVCAIRPPWQLMEGVLTFEATNLPLQREAFESWLRDSMTLRYPNEPFQLEIEMQAADWVRGMDYIVTMHCTKALADAFNLFPRKENDWQAYPLELLTYWER